MINLKGLRRSELEELLKSRGEPSYRGRQIFSWIHQKFVSSFEEMTNLGKNARTDYTALWSLESLKSMAVQPSSECDTVKYLFGLSDGEGIETVLMFFDNRLSVCVSTQAGCAYGCVFCASGQLGWKRNLETWEIVDQVLQIQKTRDDRISNVVFMGMGEPLANYDHLLSAIQIFHDPMGLGIGMRHMTVSTVGLVPGIKRLADEGLPIRLAVSLHAPNDELREKLMPVNKKYKLKELIEACHTYQSKVKRRMTFEYTLIHEVNDTRELARETAELLRGLRCHVNLIPLNPIREYAHASPPASRVRAFQSVLEEQGIPATVRAERGQDVSAACGQLRRTVIERIENHEKHVA